MGTLATAFGLAWAAVAAYITWLSILHRRTAQRLKALEAAASDSPIARRHSRAA